MSDKSLDDVFKNVETWIGLSRDSISSEEVVYSNSNGRKAVIKKLDEDGESCLVERHYSNGEVEEEWRSINSIVIKLWN